MTIYTLRPAGISYRSHTTTLVGGASENAVTSDDSDSSYMQGQVPYHTVRIPMTDHTLTGSQRVRSCMIRSRGARDNAGGATQDIGIWMIDNRVPSRGACGHTVAARNYATISTNAGPIAYSGPISPWSQIALDNLALLLIWYQNHATPLNVFQRVYEMYVDVDVNNQPTISGAPVVTNFTGNAGPTVSWLYSDVDNDPQTQWQVKIFDAATIASGGFNPDTTVATWDSGIQQGTDASVVADPVLKGGVTYTAYVNAAQDWWSGVSTVTSKWWTGWSASAPFTPVFIVPYAPVISSIAAVTDVNATRLLINVDAAVNLLVQNDASFETSVGNWVSDANCTITRSTTQFLDGIASLRLSSTAAGDMIARCELDVLNDPAVDIGRTYTTIAVFRSAVSARSCQVGIRWLDYAGTTISTVFGSSVSDTTSGWIQAFCTGVAPAGAMNAKVVVKVLATGGAAELHYVDEVSFHEGTSVSWTPGGYVNSGGDIILERGERVDRIRGLADNWADPQVASCGTVLQNANTGFSWNIFTDRVSFMWLDKSIPAVGYTPAGMIRWAPSVATTGSIAFGSWPYYPQAQWAFPVIVGSVHVFSVWAWLGTVGAGTMTVTPKIEWKNDDESLNSTTTGSNVVLTTTPQQIIVTGTCPAGASMARGTITNTNSDNTHHVYFTRCGWGLGTDPVDGKQPRGGPIVWTQVRFDYNPSKIVGFASGYSSGQRTRFVDFDAPPGRPVMYRAHVTYANGINTFLSSPYSANITVLLPPPTVTTLRSVTDPTMQVVVARRKQSTFSQIEDAAIFHPLGADGAPVKIRDWVGGEDGQLIIVTSTNAQFNRLRNLVSTNDVLAVQWAQGGLSYILITDRSMDETLSADVKWCDADGQHDWIKYVVHTLTYIDTVRP